MKQKYSKLYALNFNISQSKQFFASCKKIVQVFMLKVENGINKSTNIQRLRLTYNKVYGL